MVVIFDYLQCSLNLVQISLDVCPIYLRLHVWHRITYMPLLSKSVLWYVVFLHVFSYSVSGTKSHTELCTFKYISNFSD
jgi:hypothetical protein